MTPSQYKEDVEAQIKEWHVSLSCDPELTLNAALKSMESFKLEQNDVPLIIKLVENPKYDIGLFAGNVSLHNHDCIHVLLGRGLQLKDEAFVIGYTMGTTQKMSRWRRNLYMLCTKYLFPLGYNFGEEERFIFNMGVMAGAQCESDFSLINFNRYSALPIEKTRKRLKINKKLLVSCYEVEKKCFPKSPESQRLL